MSLEARKLDQIADRLADLTANVLATGAQLADLGRRADALDERKRTDAQRERVDAEARARRARFAVDSAERREYQARADAVLSLFGERAPESVADENSHGYPSNSADCFKANSREPMRSRVWNCSRSPTTRRSMRSRAACSPPRAARRRRLRARICRLTAAFSNGPLRTTRTAIPSGDFTAGKPS